MWVMSIVRRAQTHPTNAVRLEKRAVFQKGKRKTERPPQVRRHLHKSSKGSEAKQPSMTPVARSRSQWTMQVTKSQARIVKSEKKGAIKVSKNNHKGTNFVICVGCSDLVNLSCVPSRTWKLCAGSVDASPLFRDNHLRQAHWNRVFVRMGLRANSA